MRKFLIKNECNIMSNKLNIRLVIIFLSIFLITIGNGEYLSTIGISNFVQYLGYFILVSYIITSFFRSNFVDKAKQFFQFIIVAFLFNVGIFLQPDLETSTKVRLIFTMLVIASVALLSENFFRSFYDIRIAGYAILIGIIFSLCLSVVFHVSLLTLAVEGIGSSFGFNGGLQHKNYFAADILASYIGIYFYRYETKVVPKTDKFILFLEFILLILSNSRGGYILFAIFWMIVNFKTINVIKKNQRWIMLAISSIVFILIILLVFTKFVLESGSYEIRLQGLNNYLNMYSQNKFYLWFGNSEMAFRNTGQSYEENVRSIVGWNGTTELSILSVLIKNGVWGLIGYIYIFVIRLKGLLSLKKSDYKLAMFSIFIVLIASAFLENYIVNIQIIFGMFCYMCIASIYKMGKSKI